ncbi:MAG: M23 family metallopeptidase [Niabella sp.]
MRKETRMLQRGKIADTTSYVYDLPYPKGRSYIMVQGYFTQFTHKRRAALDFKMPVGSVVCATRPGIVIRVKNDGNQGGPQMEYRSHANYVIIQHADSTRAGYWHLKHNSVLVNIGDTVQTGQPIALSGNTGYTYFPHLHFIVWGFDANRNFIQVPTRFRTKNGSKYLRAVKKYKNPQ